MNETPIEEASKLFKVEEQVAATAEEIEKSGTASFEDFIFLKQHYLKLLRQTAKIVKLGDSNTHKLVKMQEKLEKANERLRDAAKLRGEFMGLMVHDLKNRLFPLQGLSEMLVKLTENSSGNVRDMVDIVRTSSQEMYNAVVAILERDKDLSGDIDLYRDWTDNCDLVRRIVLRNRSYAREKEIVLDDRHIVYGEAFIDEYLMGDVFDNLINNAIKFSPTQTTISISLRQMTPETEASESEVPETETTGDKEEPVLQTVQYLLTVKDQGPGLSQEDMDNMFKWFHPLTAQPTGGEKSTGMGLVMARKIARLHGGDLWAESPGAGLGATFYVRFPKDA